MAQLGFWARQNTGGAAPASRSVVDLRQWLSWALDRPVELVITRNRSTMISVRQRGSLLQLRLQEMFLGAPDQVWDALVLYIAGNNPRAGQVIDTFVRSQPTPTASGNRRLRPRGQCHDLQDIFDELNREFFHGACKARVTWGSARRTRRKRRSIQLGCYIAGDEIIRVHPCLDQSFVPRLYVSWVVFHEMLHETLGIEGHDENGRRSLHPPEFVALEESFPGYGQCMAWEKKHLDRLLRFRTGKSPQPK